MKKTNGKIKIILKRIGIGMLSVLITVMIIAAGYLMYCGISGKVAFVGNYAVVKIITPSMEPKIPAGSYIIAERVDTDSVCEGDVIMFYSRDPAIYGKLNTHRVVQINEENGARSFVTRGDNNPVNDSLPVSEGDVVGRYIGNAEKLTSFAGIMSKPYVFFFVILIPSSLLVFFSIRDVYKKYREVRMARLVAEEVKKLKEDDNSNNDNNGEGKDSIDDV